LYRTLGAVAHLYLSKDECVVESDTQLIIEWRNFEKEKSLSQFSPAMAWSFSAIFRETVEDVYRVKELGCSVVEMEAATLYAIGREKGVQALTLFVISDTLTQENWVPHFKDPIILSNLHKLADLALEFCLRESSHRSNDP